MRPVLRIQIVFCVDSTARLSVAIFLGAPRGGSGSTFELLVPSLQMVVSVVDFIAVVLLPLFASLVTSCSLRPVKKFEMGYHRHGFIHR